MLESNVTTPVLELILIPVLKIPPFIIELFNPSPIVSAVLGVCWSPVNANLVCINSEVTPLVFLVLILTLYSSPICIFLIVKLLVVLFLISSLTNPFGKTSLSY